MVNEINNIMLFLEKEKYGISISYLKNNNEWNCRIWDDLDIGNVFSNTGDNFTKVIIETFTRFILEKIPYLDRQ